MRDDALIYTGKITEQDYGENYAALFIGDAERPIAEILSEDICYCNVSVRYWISDTEKDKQQLQEDTLDRISGKLDADYNDRYSDITGYLWTDEELKIGGHDLMAELRDSVGKFIYLEIDVH